MKLDDVKICKDCGEICDYDEPECPECGGKLGVAYECEMCYKAVQGKSELKWHRDMHMEGYYIRPEHEELMKGMS